MYDYKPKTKLGPEIQDELGILQKQTKTASKQVRNMVEAAKEPPDILPIGSFKLISAQALADLFRIPLRSAYHLIRKLNLPYVLLPVYSQGPNTVKRYVGLHALESVVYAITRPGGQNFAFPKALSRLSSRPRQQARKVFMERVPQDLLDRLHDPTDPLVLEIVLQSLKYGAVTRQIVEEKVREAAEKLGYTEGEWGGAGKKKKGEKGKKDGSCTTEPDPRP